jgi:hypothetical protein
VIPQNAQACERLAGLLDRLAVLVDLPEVQGSLTDGARVLRLVVASEARAVYS